MKNTNEITTETETKKLNTFVKKFFVIHKYSLTRHIYLVAPLFPPIAPKINELKKVMKNLVKVIFLKLHLEKINFQMRTSINQQITTLSSFKNKKQWQNNHKN